ncbi:MAG: carboxypeptidase-like regulatory domain-containing protein [Nanoarchaeota archaeon]
MSKFYTLVSTIILLTILSGCGGGGGNGSPTVPPAGNDNPSNNDGGNNNPEFDPQVEDDMVLEAEWCSELGSNFTVYGKITNPDGTPIASGDVQVVDPYKGTCSFVKSDKDGKFSYTTTLTQPGIKYLVFSFFSETRYVPVNAGNGPWADCYAYEIKVDDVIEGYLIPFVNNNMDLLYGLLPAATVANIGKIPNYVPGKGNAVVKFSFFDYFVHLDAPVGTENAMPYRHRFWHVHIERFRQSPIYRNLPGNIESIEGFISNDLFKKGGKIPSIPNGPFNIFRDATGKFASILQNPGALLERSAFLTISLVMMANLVNAPDLNPKLRISNEFEAEGFTDGFVCGSDGVCTNAQWSSKLVIDLSEHADDITAVSFSIKNMDDDSHQIDCLIDNQHVKSLQLDSGDEYPTIQDGQPVLNELFEVEPEKIHTCKIEWYDEGEDRYQTSSQYFGLNEQKIVTFTIPLIISDDPGPPPPPLDGYIKVKVANHDNDDVTVYYSVDDTSYDHSLFVSSGGSKTGASIHVKGNANHTVNIKWFDSSMKQEYYDSSGAKHVESSKTVTVDFGLPLHDPPLNKGNIHVSATSNDNSDVTVSFSIDEPSYDHSFQVPAYGNGYSNPDIEVDSGNHTVYIKWYDPDTGAHYTKEQSKNVLSGMCSFFDFVVDYHVQSGPADGYIKVSANSGDDDAVMVEFSIDIMDYGSYFNVPAYGNGSDPTSYNVSGNESHTVYMQWQDPDTGTQWYSKQETKNVSENTTVDFVFTVDAHSEPQADDGYARISLDNNDDDWITVQYSIDNQSYDNAINASPGGYDQTGPQLPVLGDECHTMYIRWQDPDTGSQYYYNDKEKFVSSGQVKLFTFDIDPYGGSGGTPTASINDVISTSGDGSENEKTSFNQGDPMCTHIHWTHGGPACYVWITWNIVRSSDYHIVHTHSNGYNIAENWINNDSKSTTTLNIGSGNYYVVGIIEVYTESGGELVTTEIESGTHFTVY